MKKSIAIAVALTGALSLGGCCPKASAPAACPPCAQSAKAPAAEDVVVATYGGQKMTMAELDRLTARNIYEMRQQAIEAKVLTDLVEAEAKKAGVDADAFLRGIAEKAVANVPEEQLQAMYEQLKPRLGDKSFEDVKPMLESMLKQDDQKKAVMEYIEGLKKSANVQILLEEPKVEVKAVGPSRGQENAPVTIVEFSDFECPYCARAAGTIDQVVKANEGKVRLVFRAYPLPFHPHAKKASEAALCANEQGKFWEMHDAMFGAQDKLEVADLKATAKELGMDSAAFDGCLDSGKYAAEIEANVKEGAEAGIEGTPAFVINGRLVSGAQSNEAFQKVIDEALAK